MPMATATSTTSKVQSNAIAAPPSTLLQARLGPDSKEKTDEKVLDQPPPPPQQRPRKNDKGSDNDGGAQEEQPQLQQ